MLSEMTRKKKKKRVGIMRRALGRATMKHRMSQWQSSTASPVRPEVSQRQVVTQEVQQASLRSRPHHLEPPLNLPRLTTRLITTPGGLMGAIQGEEEVLEGDADTREWRAGEAVEEEAEVGGALEVLMELFLLRRVVVGLAVEAALAMALRCLVI